MPFVFPHNVTHACNVLAPFVVEFVGTFFLVLSIHLNVLNASDFAPFGIGLTLVALVFAGGHISGAHYNPAVTLAVWLSRRRKISGVDALIYVAVQVAAALLAGFLSWFLKSDTFAVQPGSEGDGRAFVGETVWTFLLATVVLQTATTETQAGNSFFGLSIGFTVVAGAITIGPISGGVFNPAVGTGVLVVDAIHKDNGENLKYLWIYWLGPLLGGLLAGITFWFTNRREFHDDPSETEQNEPHLFSTDVRSIADVSAQKREGGKIIKGIIKKEAAHLGLHAYERVPSDDDDSKSINSSYTAH